MEVRTVAPWTDPPADCPPELVFDVDIFNLEGAEDGVHAAWKRLQDEKPPIFWTGRNGGYWMMTRARDIEHTQSDYEHFSMKEMLIPNLPRPYPAPPFDYDPPEHAAWRLLLSPAFSPKVVSEVEGTVRDIAVETIERLLPQGECEFVGEFAKVLPIVVFLTMMQLPQEDREELLVHADALAHSPDPEVILRGRTALRTYVENAIAERKARPRDDLMSKILNSEIDGKPIPETHVVGMCTILLGGGLDTVRNLLSFSALFLAEHPGHVRQLREDPSLIPHAVEELIRRHGVSNTARLVRKDLIYHGIQLRAGQQIQAASPLYGLDDAIVPDPMTVDFSRPAPIPHAAFGNGPHRCPGAILARRELKVWLEEWLPRLPEFRIKPGTKPKQGAALMNHVGELWLSWK